MSNKKENKLKDALETMLVLANNKLSLAKAREKKWDIEHYENDIQIINKQLSTIK